MAINEKHIISTDEFLQLARPASKHLDKDEVDAYVREVEDMEVVPLIGIALFHTLTEAVSLAELTDEERILFAGGEYTADGCSCGDTKVCAGLKRAVAYLAYAKMLAANGGIITRTGYMQHNDTYASRMDDTNKANARRDVQNMADYYFGQCVEYYKHMTGECCKGQGHRGTLVRIKSIGK